MNGDWKKKKKGVGSFMPADIFTRDDIPHAIIKNGWGVRFEGAFFKSVEEAKTFAEMKYLQPSC